MPKGKTSTPVLNLTPIRVGFHTGKTLARLADHYNRPEDTFLEPLQNSLDAGAKRVKIIINQALREILILDDGEGASLQELTQKFVLMGQSLKTGEKLGRFGIGILAALEGASRFSIITKPRSDAGHPFIRLSFSRALWEKEELELHPERVDSPDFSDEWTTSLKMNEVDPQKLEELGNASIVEEHILGKFGAVIAKRKGTKTEVAITISIISRTGKLMEERQVALPEFPGKPQQVVEIKTAKGPVRLELSVTLKPEKRPVLLIVFALLGGFSIPLQNIWIFAKEAGRNIQDVFASGHFHGKITVGFGTIHPNRVTMVMDEDFTHFLGAIETYCEKYGRPLLKKLAEERVFAKTAEILQGAIDRFEKIFRKNPELFPEGLRAFVTEHHKSTDTAPKTADPYRRKPRETPKQKREGGAETPLTGREEYDIFHGASGDPEGQKRRVVSGQQGLTIRPVEDSLTRDWRMRVTNDGIIELNVSHPRWRWVASQKPEIAETYVLHLLCGQFSCLRMGSEQGPIFQTGFDIFLTYWESQFQ